MDHLHTVQIPEAGEGVELFFKNSDMLTIRKKFGANWMIEFEQGLARLDVEVIELALAVGGKKEGKAHKLNLDDVALHLSSISEKLLDAFAFTTFGRSYQEQAKLVQEQVEKLRGGEEDGRPPRTGETSSPVSTAEPVAQESLNLNSGN